MSVFNLAKQQSLQEQKILQNFIRASASFYFYASCDSDG